MCRLRHTGLVAALLVTALALPGCDRNASPTTAAPPSASTAEEDFRTLAAACAQSVASRLPTVQADSAGRWTQSGYSPAQVQHEVAHTESPITPYVGKIVVKDNLAQAHAGSEAEAQAITLTPANLHSNRTHTFVYSFDGQKWRWNNGSRLTKVPGQPDTVADMPLADVSVADSGFAGCLPR